MSVKRLIITFAVVALGAALVAGCGGKTSATKVASSKPAASASAAQSVSLKIGGATMSKALGYTTPDGKGHDTFIPANFSVKVGSKVTVTVNNYDEGPHSFTSPDLGVNVQIPGAKNADKKIPSVTKFTFTAAKSGKFRWFCAMPCDKKANMWAMSAGPDGPSRDGYMAGFVTAS